MLDPQSLVIVRDKLTAQDFYRPAHQTIYSAIMELASENAPLDAVSTKARLEDKKALERVGGLEYLAKILESVPSTANIGYYVGIVKDKSVKRCLWQLTRSVGDAAIADQQTAKDVLIAGQTKMYELYNSLQTEVDHAGTLGDSAIKVMQDIRAGKLTYWPTGLRSLDKVITGFAPGNYVTIGARTGTYKTALALHIAYHYARTHGPVIYVSGEMPRWDLAKRIIQAIAEVSNDAVRRRQLTEEQLARLDTATREVAAVPLHLIGRSMDLASIAIKARSITMSSMQPVSLIIIDYLQLMKLPRAATRREAVAEYSASLKQLALSMNCVVIGVSQLRRMETGEKERRPTEHDLKESGSIEQDSDLILLLMQAEGNDQYQNIEGRAALQLWVRLAKYREGMVTGWPDGDQYAPRLYVRPGESRFLGHI